MLDEVTKAFKDWDTAIGHIEFKENGIPDHDSLLNDLTQNNGDSL